MDKGALCLLLSSNANPNRAMTQAHTREVMNAARWGGYTPLEMARGNVAITRELLAAGSDVQERPWDWER